MKYFISLIFLIILYNLLQSGNIKAQEIPDEFINPPREFSVMPFWFWNDSLKDEEIVKQIAGFEEHGVYGFVIHPRIGLPENVKWLSDEMISAMKLAIEEAARRNMYVILYDEGMYPSGSSGGQVVSQNPNHAARGLAKIDLKPGETLQLSEEKKLITIIKRPEGDQVAVVDQPSGGNIRGLHYFDEGTGHMKEELPPAGDILNPDAVTSFIELVYDRYAKEFGKYFGTTIIGIFTDEPSPLGRGVGKNLVPGNAALFKQINSILGYDIKPFLADLWYTDSPESMKHRTDYNRAINICLEENYFMRLGKWCKDHGISLMGHPASSMDIGAERYFQVPGQDLVWRYVEPGYKAIEGEHSTMAKCASSAMLHLGLRKNSNELYGAYGHNLTYDEMLWLANWCFVRGQNLLFPHAFYYSVRGPRFDERPPDVGPNASWWNNYKSYADACRRLCWINTDSHQVCEIAVLADATWLPCEAPKACYQNQLDFNYLEIRHLWEDARVDAKGVHIAGINYSVLILDSLPFLPEKVKPILRKLARKGRLIIRENSVTMPLLKRAIVYKNNDDLISSIHKIIKPDLLLTNPSEDMRYRHVIKGRDHFYIIFNEGESTVTTYLKTSATGNRQFLNPVTAEALNTEENENVSFKPHELKILRINDYFKLPLLSE